MRSANYAKIIRPLELVSRHRAASGDAGGPVLEVKKSAEWAEAPNTRAAMLESWSDSDSDEVLKVGVLLISSGRELTHPYRCRRLKQISKSKGTSLLALQISLPTEK